MRSVAPDLVGVYPRGLVAVVAVRDQELGMREGFAHGGVDLRVGDPPDAVDGPVGIGRLAPGIIAGARFHGRPGVAGMQGEDRREVVPGRPGEPQAVLLRARLRALVGTDLAGAVIGDANPGEQAASLPSDAV